MYKKGEVSYVPLPLPHRVQLPDGDALKAALSFRDYVRKRHSVRDYSDRPVPKEIITACIEAAAWAREHGSLWTRDVIAFDGHSASETSQAASPSAVSWETGGQRLPHSDARVQRARAARGDQVQLNNTADRRAPNRKRIGCAFSPASLAASPPT